MRLNPPPRQKRAREERKNQSAAQAEHPDWEIGADDVDGWRSRTGCKNQAQQRNETRPRACVFHGFRAPGVCGRVAGGRLRKRFPVTYSRFTAWRKSSDRAATLESRAKASCFSAVTTSTRFLTP